EVHRLVDGKPGRVRRIEPGANGHSADEVVPSAVHDQEDVVRSVLLSARTVLENSAEGFIRAKRFGLDEEADELAGAVHLGRYRPLPPGHLSRSGGSFDHGLGSWAISSGSTCEVGCAACSTVQWCSPKTSSLATG